MLEHKPLGSSGTPYSERDGAAAERRTIIRDAVTNGSIRYIHGCEARIDEFVRVHFSFRGALRLHAHAIGLDVIRVPLNIVWSLANILFSLLGLAAGMLKLRKFQAWLSNIPPGIETDMDRQISWLVVTELLRLPHKQGTKRSDEDALMEEIMKDPSLQRLLSEELKAFEYLSGRPDFRERLEAKLLEYGATRTGISDVASNAALLITSQVATGKPAFGALSAGTTASAAIAKSVAISNFWLGSTIGSYYYALVPVAVSLRLLIAVTAAVAIVLAIVSTFIGILTDPLQAKMGLHQRRLKKLVHSIRDDLLGNDGKQFALREKYIGRLFDVIDVLSALGRAP